MKKIILSLFSFSCLYFISCTPEQVSPNPGSIAEGSTQEKKQAGNINYRIVAGNFNLSSDITWGPDNYIWVTERQGKISRVNPVSGEVIPLAAIPEVAVANNSSGLLGLAIHPQFGSNPFLYVAYNYYNGAGAYLQKVVRMTYNGSALINPMVMVDGIAANDAGTSAHNGSCILIGPDMKLYITTGDADNRSEFPQNTSSLNGKVLRLNLDGSIPADNPFGNAVWSTGDCNSEGMVFVNGKLYATMNGENNDEINIITRGANNGWPFVEGLCDHPDEQPFCNGNNLNAPIYTWPSPVSPGGIGYYNDDLLTPWKNSLLVASRGGKKLLLLKMNNAGTSISNSSEYFVNSFGRIQDIAVSATGKVYLCTDNGNNSDVIIEIFKGNSN